MSPELQRFKRALHHHAEHQGNVIALWGDHLKMDYAATYAEVLQRQQRLRDEHVEVVALALDNGVDAMLWDLAILFEGLTCLTLPPFFSPPQRTYCLEQCQAGLVIAAPGLDAELPGCCYEKDGAFWRRTFTTPGRMPRGTAKLTFTSGTTGAPKGVCLSAESLLTVAFELDQASRPTQPHHHLTLLPLAILLENLGCYAALYAGATLSLPGLETLGIEGASHVDVPRLLKCLAGRAPASLILVPQLLLVLVNAAEQKAFDPRTLRFAAVGGAPVSPALLDRALRAGLPVYEGYGLSECASVVCLNRPGALRRGSVGRPMPHVEVRLAKDGEIMIKGSTLLGYLGEEPHAGEWWPSGDLGEFDREGFLFLKGRKKHQFVTSFGRNVNPEWVEAELTQQGDLAQAFVYGEAMPSNHALLWPRNPACTDQDLAAAVGRANAGLPDYAQVHHWTRLDQPFSPANGLLTANGRLRRDAIIARYQPQLTNWVISKESAS
jgi:long-subunit acyl-CoA synthetase (AMP-forming)